MADQDWLSLSEIARRWSEETGRNAEEIAGDLEAWFADFVERERTRQPEPSDDSKDTTNLLMGLLGGQYLQRETFATYCEETGHVKPQFWFAEGVEEEEPTPPAVAPADEALKATAEKAAEAAESLDAVTAAEPPEPLLEPDPLDPYPDVEEQEPASERPAKDVSQSASEPLRHAKREPSPAAIAWPPPPRTGWPRRTILLLAGAMALASLAGGYILGQRGGLAPQSAPSVAAPDEASTALVAALRDDVAGARQKIAILAAALDKTEKEKARLTSELHKTQRALDAAPSPTRPEATGSTSAAPRDREAAAEVAALKAELAAARAKIASLNQTAEAPQSEAVKRSLIETATAASAQAMSFKAELEDARQSIVALELEAQSAQDKADALAAELAVSRQQSQTALQDAEAEANPTRQQLILAAEIAGTQAALTKQDLDDALERLARFESEAQAAQAAQAKAASLASQLADTRRLHSEAMKTAETAAAAARQDLLLKAQSASSHAAKLDREIDIARARIADLEAQVSAARAESAGLAGQLAALREDHAAARQRALAEGQGERTDPPAAPETATAEAVLRQRQPEAAPQSLATAEPPAAEHEPAQNAAEMAANGTPPPAPAAPRIASAPQSLVPKPGQPLALLEQQVDPSVLAREASARSGSARAASAPRSSQDRRDQVAVARPRASQAAESVNVDSLVTNPGRYHARRVVVTGSLLRLLEHYRLESRSGLRTLIVDVAGIERAQFETLQQAIDQAGLIGSVRARISGTVEPLSANAFRLVADDLIMLE